MELAGKRVLLTGATGGLGEAAARELANAGSKLVLSGRNAAALAALAESLKGDGHETIVADLSEPGAGADLVQRAGVVDVFIANAGLPGGAALIDIDETHVADVVRVNLETPIQMARAVMPQMRERGAGHLVFIASLAGKFALPESSLYSATKFGLRGFAWSLRGELAQHGVGVSLVTPGFISEVGMFARRGRKPPFGTGTRKPEHFSRALIDAIEHNRGEVVVAPLLLRALGQFALEFPGPLARVLSRARPERREQGTPQDSGGD